MKTLKIFHNNRCSKSRAALEILKSSNLAYEVVNYLNTPPSFAEFEALLGLLGLEPQDITRKTEDRYEELGLDASPPKNRSDWIRILVENPILIERPIVTDGKRALVCRPPERAKELL